MRIFGTEVEVHPTFSLFFLLLVFSLLVFYPSFFLSGLLLYSFLFLSVLAHEFVHLSVARALGVKTDKITLLPIGGVARIHLLGIEPWKEILIAVSGPLFNLLLAFLLTLLSLALSLPFPQNITEETLFLYPHLGMIEISLFLGLFNLLVPALPMDGGRIFRALLSLFLGPYRATRIAYYVSSFLSALMVLVGLFSNRFLIFIGAFVYLGALSELHQYSLLESLSRRRVGEFVRGGVFVSPRSRSSGILFPSLSVRVGGRARRVRRVVVNEPADRVLIYMTENELPFLPMFSGEALVGVVYAEDLQAY